MGTIHATLQFVVESRSSSRSNVVETGVVTIRYQFKGRSGKGGGLLVNLFQTQLSA